MIGASFAIMTSAYNRMNFAQMGQVRVTENEMAMIGRPRFGGAAMGDTFARSMGNQQANLRFQTMMAVAEAQEKQARKWLKNSIDNWFADFSSK